MVLIFLTSTWEAQGDVGRFRQGRVLDPVNWRAAVLVGTLDWPAAWIFMAEFVIGGLAVTLWLAWRDPGLLKERMAGPFQKGSVSPLAKGSRDLFG